jgi:tetratricopeptide (TPR) repeat protein/2-polyprenyl-3-methyl-5-hydroxy-6-metoxy-1,4-benzoquinol methylase
VELQDVKERQLTPNGTSLFVRAVDLHRVGRLRDAEGIYRRVLARQPEHIHCLYNLGLLTIQRGHPGAAVALIEKAIVLGGRVPEWHYNLAFALRATGRLNDAITQYERAIDLKPDYVEAIMNLGNALKDHERPKEAANQYRRAIELNPLLTEAYYNLANVLAEQSEWENAAVVYARAIALKPDFAEAHNNLATVLGNQGAQAEAVAHYQRALALNPNLVESQVNIGKIWAQEGKLDDAIEQYRRALALKPDLVQAHNNMSVALLAKGDLDAAMAACRNALALNPGLAEAHDHLGIMLLARGNTREAIRAFERALTAKPDFLEAHNNLARAYLAERNVTPALAFLGRALAIRETSETKTLFVDCLKDVLSVPDAALIHPLVVRALCEPWGRQSDIARFSSRLLMRSMEIGAAVARAAEAWPNQLPLDDLLRSSEREAMAKDPLLAGLLDSGHVPDIALERFLTLLRSAVLNVAMEMAEPDQVAPDELALYCALARLCFRNDYVFTSSNAEIQAVETLSDRLSTATRSGAPIPALWLVAIGAYVPLHKVPEMASLCRQSWPQSVLDLLDLQVNNTKEEQKLKDSLPRLTPIEDHMSKLIREQYEENPYPRWAKPAPTPSYSTFDEYLRRLLRCAAFVPLGKRDTIDVLVAGCGTGQHPTEVAQRLSHARILAVDLSLTSLAYAKRQALALGLDNIEYAQADIVELAALNRTFDVIESAGVLHHLPDPNAGSQVLVSLLRPGGFLFLALYSDIARRDIVQVRDFIAARGYRATAQDIRHCRQELMDAAIGTPLHNVTQSVDFYSTSECRDLLFHAQEQRTTLPEIKAFLAANRLQFLGFEIDPWTRQRFSSMFPNDVAMVDLDHWHDFEQVHPRTFARMYQFWAQKVPDR